MGGGGAPRIRDGLAGGATGGCGQVAGSAPSVLSLQTPRRPGQAPLVLIAVTACEQVVFLRDAPTQLGLCKDLAKVGLPAASPAGREEPPETGPFPPLLGHHSPPRSLTRAQVPATFSPHLLGSRESRGVFANPAGCPDTNPGVSRSNTCIRCLIGT